MPSTGLLAALCCLAVTSAQHVKVEPSVSGFLGNQVVLRCQFVDPAASVTVTQVTWVKDPSGAKQNLAVHNPDLGTNYPTNTGGRIHFRDPSLRDATLVIDRLLMSDDGIYSCEFATYPEGNQEAATNLTVLATPKNTANPVVARAGDSEVPVATCTSAEGKPASSISWEGNVPGNASTEHTLNPDGTTTVSSKFQAVPTGPMDGTELRCVVTQRTLGQPQVIPVTLSVQYPPIVTIEGYDDNWYLEREHASLTCNVKANPAAGEYKWYMNGGSIPSSMRMMGHQLTVDRVSYQVNGTFTCEASNSLGRSSGSVDIVVRERKAGTSNAGAIAGGVIGGILALLLVVCLAGFLLRRRRREAAGSYDPKTRVFGVRNGAAPQPDFAYRPDSDSEKGPSLVPTTPTTTAAEESLLPASANYPEEEEEKEEGPVLSPTLHKDLDPVLEDDMESQRDGSIISKKAVYV
ncbi:nectin-1-like isoform X2 [Pristis pectinata]|uniref:nectin-1-like isoform X2 n=1 Tax=Pristis pectinata TaxID=685728 RepID=UPI00223E183F|nr:nectin-1-like isoform X2 [Pristis pectinata]